TAPFAAYDLSRKGAARRREPLGCRHRRPYLAVTTGPRRADTATGAWLCSGDQRLPALHLARRRTESGTTHAHRGPRPAGGAGRSDEHGAAQAVWRAGAEFAPDAG